MSDSAVAPPANPGFTSLISRDISVLFRFVFSGHGATKKHEESDGRICVLKVNKTNAGSPAFRSQSVGVRHKGGA